MLYVVLFKCRGICFSAHAQKISEQFAQGRENALLKKECGKRNGNYIRNIYAYRTYTGKLGNPRYIRI